MSERHMRAVSSGSYSDYSVLCLCESEAEAERVAEKVRGVPDSWHGDAFIDRFLVADSSVERVLVHRLSVTLWDDGTETESHQSATARWPWEGDFDPCAWRWVRAPCHHGKGGRLDVWGTQLARVRKVFTEKRALFKADRSFSSHGEMQGKCERVR